MLFGFAKCAKTTFKRGRLTETADLKVDMNTKIKELEQERAI